jgi:hypothetical protein
VTCPSHGAFEIKARNHLWIGQGCNSCYKERQGKSRIIGVKAFSQESKRIHGKKYLYDLSSYSKHTASIKIKCKVHGWFRQKASKHLSGQGCPTCARLRPGRWDPKLIPPENRKEKCCLYFLRFKLRKEVFFKIGISNNLERRIRTLKKQSGYIVLIQGVLHSTLFRCMSLEVRLKKSLRAYSYCPATKFPGYLECFSVNALRTKKVKLPKELYFVKTL